MKTGSVSKGCKNQTVPHFYAVKVLASVERIWVTTKLHTGRALGDSSHSHVTLGETEDRRWAQTQVSSLPGLHCQKTASEIARSCSREASLPRMPKYARLPMLDNYSRVLIFPERYPRAKKWAKTQSFTPF